MGANVTVPYKVQILDLLDGLDKKAAQIKAVNTIVRSNNGKLVGYNTDGSGFIESIQGRQFGQRNPFIKSLKGTDVLMIGAGGSARAIAFYLAERLGNGTLLICNRTTETAMSLAEEVSNLFGNVKAIHERDIPEWAPKVGLIVNCSTKGQGGIRKTPDGRITMLEPYSALAPANPSTFSGSDEAKLEFHRNWLSASLADINANNEASLRLAVSIPSDVKFCDLIYFPVETVFLRHGRLSGHQTLNGKGMNVAQAADAFFNKVCKQYLQARKMLNSKTYQRVVEIMSAAW
jgi:shikimate 5-dehydrogenase